MSVPQRIQAVLSSPKDGEANVVVGELPLEELGDGDVVIRIGWSSVNYKDGLATQPDGKVARIDPLVPGVDLAGEVVESTTAAFRPGTKVIAHGHDLGV